jgi:conjugative transposon TraN protein
MKTKTFKTFITDTFYVIVIAALLLFLSMPVSAQSMQEITVLPSRNNRPAQDTTKTVQQKQPQVSQTSASQSSRKNQSQQQARPASMKPIPAVVIDTLIVTDTVVIVDTFRLYELSPEDVVRFRKIENRTDLFQGLTKKISYERMIPPYGLEVTFDKTVHIIFPSPIAYVDLGSDRIIAAKAGTAENVLRVKSADEYFFEETNMSVITESGSFYTFNVKFAIEPEKLNVEMADFMHDGSTVNRPNNSMDVFLKELNNVSPSMVKTIMQSIHAQNQRIIRHVGSRMFGIQYTLKGIYSHNGMLYFHTEIRNNTNVPYNIDYLKMKIVDKKLVQRITIQETIITPVRAFNYVTSVGARKTENTIFAVPLFTIPQEKKMVFELVEKQGGRDQVFEIENSDLVRARTATEFSILWSGANRR